MQFMGLLQWMRIEMDGRDLARVANGQDWAGDVEPGRHLLWVRCGLNRSKEPLELVLAPGDDVRLQTRLSNNRLSLVRTDRATAGPPVGSHASPLAVQVLGVTETHRSAEPIGTDTRQIDNTSGAGRVTRTIRVTMEWTRMVSLDLHEGDTDASGITVGPNWLALKTSIEHSLERTYAISVSRREEFAEEIGVEIDPGADVTVNLAWKRIWQHGLARVLAQGSEANVPFRMAVGVTFDQSMG
jgi:hypothetical protein